MVSLLKHDLELLSITPDKERSLSAKPHDLRREMLPLRMVWCWHIKAAELSGAFPRPCQHSESSKAFREPTQFKLMVTTFWNLWS